MLTAEHLRSRLSYNPETGEFLWRMGRMKGQKAGTIQIGPYPRRKIRIADKYYYASRLAWLYMTDEWPRGEIDHINRDATDDRWTNLRDVSHSENQLNRGPYRRRKSRSLPQGVEHHYGKYGARITVRKKRIWLGTFRTVGQAAKAYEDAKKRLL